MIEAVFLRVPNKLKCGGSKGAANVNKRRGRAVKSNTVGPGGIYSPQDNQSANN